MGSAQSVRIQPKSQQILDRCKQTKTYVSSNLYLYQIWRKIRGVDLVEDHVDSGIFEHPCTPIYLHTPDLRIQMLRKAHKSINIQNHIQNKNCDG